MDSQEMQQVIDRLNQIETSLKDDINRLEDRFNVLSAQGIPGQVDVLYQRMETLSQRLWMVAVGWVFTLAGWVWNMTR